jgi:hypothetical protein
MIGSEEKTVIRGRDGERDRPQASAGSRPSGSSDVGILRLRIYSNGIEGEVPMCLVVSLRRWSPGDELV